MNGEKQIAANPDLVRRLVDHLVVAYEEFINNSPDRVGHVDGFMAAHNFHAAIIFQLEREGEMNADSAKLLRRMAVDTFNERMKREPLP